MESNFIHGVIYLRYDVTLLSVSHKPYLIVTCEWGHKTSVICRFNRINSPSVHRSVTTKLKHPFSVIRIYLRYVSNLSHIAL
jgi:hypothetical protein